MCVCAYCEKNGVKPFWNLVAQSTGRRLIDFIVYFSLFFSIQREQLIRKLAVILDVQDEDIIVEHLKEAGVGHT